MSTNNGSDSAIEDVHDDNTTQFNGDTTASSPSESRRESSPNLSQENQSDEEIKSENVPTVEKKEKRSDPEQEKSPKTKRRGVLGLWKKYRHLRGTRQATFPKSLLRQNQRKHLTKECVIAYRTLLEEMKRDADPKCHKAIRDASAISTEFGPVQWTKREVDKFFTALALKGRGSIKEIAELVQSKSPLEVQQFIINLQGGLQEIREENEDQLAKFFDIPAVTEIGRETEQVLERLAEHVSILDQAAESIEGKKKHGSGNWIIDSETASKIDKSDGKDDIDFWGPGLPPVTKLFHLEKWVHLSRRVYMNSGTSQMDENWRNIAFKDESPSLTADAFVDFYTLTLSITKRLTKASLEFAQDRIDYRLDKDRYHEHKPLVKQKDVFRALRSTSMPRNAFHHFVGVARRRHLDIAEISHEKGSVKHNRYLSYDEAERILSKRRRIDHILTRPDAIPPESGSNSQGEESENSDDRESMPSSNEDDESQDDDQNDYIEEEVEGEGEDVGSYDDDDESEGEEEENDDDNVNDHEENDDNDYSGDYNEDDEDKEVDRDELKLHEYTEFIDQEASKDSEIELRKFLTCPDIDALPPIVKAGPDEAPPVPESSIKRHSDVDWMDELDYKAEWETYGPQWKDVEKDVAKNHKRRRLQ